MKNITSSLTGLTSSLLLNVGLTAAAQKLDPVSSRPSYFSHDAHGPAYTMPSAFTPKPRR
jgi:hypothetical protein